MKKFRIVTSIAVSNCGNYLFIGHSDAVIIKLSTQSGKLVSDFEDSISDNICDPLLDIFCDLYNHFVIARVSQTFYWLDFIKGLIINKHQLENVKIDKAIFDWNIELLAITDICGKLILMNVINFEIVRQITVVQSRILDLCFISIDWKIILTTDDK